MRLAPGGSNHDPPQRDEYSCSGIAGTRRTSRSIGKLSPVMAITAFKLSLVDNFDFSTFNLERLGNHQSLGNLSVRRFDNPAEGLPGNPSRMAG
jgi:hypothetical protein